MQDGVAAELHGLRRVKATRFERRVAGRHDGLKDDIFGRCGVLNFWRVNSTRQKIDTIFFDLERDEETRKRRACTILPNGLTTEGTQRLAPQCTDQARITNHEMSAQVKRTPTIDAAIIIETTNVTRQDPHAVGCLCVYAQDICSNGISERLRKDLTAVQTRGVLTAPTHQSLTP